MTLKEAQETVDHWIKTVGVRYFDEMTNTAILMEEVGEVAPWSQPGKRSSPVPCPKILHWTLGWSCPG